MKVAAHSFTHADFLGSAYIRKTVLTARFVLHSSDNRSRTVNPIDVAALARPVIVDGGSTVWPAWRRWCSFPASTQLGDILAA